MSDSEIKVVVVPKSTQLSGDLKSFGDNPIYHYHSGDLSPIKPTMTDSLTKRIPELADSIATIANSLRERLDQKLKSAVTTEYDLETVEMSFSIELEAEAGVIVTRAKSSAGFEIKLGWQRRHEP